MPNIKTLLEKTLQHTPPKTALGKAAHYLHNQWPRLAHYLDDGAYPIDNNRAEMRIAVDGAFAQYIVFQALEKVSALYPQVNIDIIDTALSGTNELIGDGQADIGLSPFPMKGCLNEELCLIEFLAVAHKDHALHKLGHTLSEENLKSCRQIIVRDSASQTKADAGWLGAEQRWTVSHIRASIELIKQNLGFAWLPMPEITDALASGDIKALNLTAGGSRSVSFYLNYLDKDRIGPAAQEFIAELRLLTLGMPTSES